MCMGVSGTYDSSAVAYRGGGGSESILAALPNGAEASLPNGAEKGTKMTKKGHLKFCRMEKIFSSKRVIQKRIGI